MVCHHKHKINDNSMKCRIKVVKYLLSLQIQIVHYTHPALFPGYFHGLHS